MNETEGFFNRGGPPALSFHDKVNYYAWANVWRGGLVLADPILRKVIDPKTKEVKTWDDGSDRLKMVVTLECQGGQITLPDGTVVQVRDERNPADPKDRGHRRLFIQGYMVDGVRTAIHGAGAQGISTGGRLYVAWTDEKPSTHPTFGPGKLFSGLYVPPAVAVPRGAPAPQNGLASQQGGTPFGPPGQQATATPGPAFAQAVQQGQQQAAQLVGQTQQAGYQGGPYQPPQGPAGGPFGQPEHYQAHAVTAGQYPGSEGPFGGGQASQQPAAPPPPSFVQQAPAGNPFGQAPQQSAEQPQPPQGFVSPFGGQG